MKIDLIKDNELMIKEWLKQGVSKKQIAENLGISQRTLRRYREKNPKIFDVLSDSKEDDKTSNAKVEYALLKNALGYEYEEETATKIKEEVLAEDGKTILQKEKVKIVKLKKRVKPDVAAQKFWLSNRKDVYWSSNPQKVKTDKELLELRKKELENKLIIP